MKRSLPALAASLVILVLTACGGYDRNSFRYAFQPRNDLFELQLEPVEGDVPPVTFNLNTLHEQIRFRFFVATGGIISESRFLTPEGLYNRLFYAFGPVPDRTKPNYGFKVGDTVQFVATVHLPEGGLRLSEVRSDFGTAKVEEILGDPNDDENDIVVVSVTSLLAENGTGTKRARLSGTIRVDFRLPLCGEGLPPCPAP
jgi:hypothetical protein